MAEYLPGSQILIEMSIRSGFSWARRFDLRRWSVLVPELDSLEFRGTPGASPIPAIAGFTTVVEEQ